MTRPDPRATEMAGPRTRLAQESEPELTWREQLKRALTSTVFAAYTISLLIHLLLLIHMRRWRQSAEQAVTTVVQSDQQQPVNFDDLVDTQLPVIGGADDEAVPQQFLAEETDRELNLLEHKFLEDVTAADVKGDESGGGIGAGGFRLLEPKNAVRKGSFTAWTIPIPQRFGEKPEPGDSPRPGQAYHIVIQVQLPEGRRNYPINDLSGKVVGTDSYIQLIPAGAFVQDDQGRLVRARIGRRLPVVEGVAQILIRVPGAEALVKDTIRVKSQILKEEQTLELVFGKPKLE